MKYTPNTADCLWLNSPQSICSFGDVVLLGLNSHFHNNQKEVCACSWYYSFPEAVLLEVISYVKEVFT